MCFVSNQMLGSALTYMVTSADVVGLDGYSTLPDRSRAAQVGYQIADALAGFTYTFCMTMLILYGLKVVRFIFRRKWSAGFKKPLKAGRMRLQATPQHEWLDPPVQIPLQPLQPIPPDAVA
jgi:hypothetical protein